MVYFDLAKAQLHTEHLIGWSFFYKCSAVYPLPQLQFGTPLKAYLSEIGDGWRLYGGLIQWYFN